MAPPLGNTTYMNIPPPPLPEFYLPKHKLSKKTAASCTDDTADSSESSSQQASAVAHGEVDERRPRNKKRTSNPPLASSHKSHKMSSMEVYHICRICLRARSRRYHREHPIPFDGVPPPPGICDRCRVTPADDANIVASAHDANTVARAYEDPTSSETKLGVKCLVPDEDYFTREQMRSKGASHIAAKGERTETRPTRKTGEPTAEERVGYRYVILPPLLPLPTPAPPSCPLSSGYPPPMRTSTERPKVQAIVESAGKDSPREQNEPTHNKSTPVHVYRPGHTESEIRGFAREEVERYRQAERIMESHRSAYAHGKLREVEPVPARRRIELQGDVAEQMPWKQSIAQASTAKPREVLVEQSRRRPSVHVESKPAQPPTSRDNRASVRYTDLFSNISDNSDKTRYPSTVFVRQGMDGRNDGKHDANTRSTPYKAIRVPQQETSTRPLPANRDLRGQDRVQPRAEQIQDTNSPRRPSGLPDQEGWKYAQSVKHPAGPQMGERGLGGRNEASRHESPADYRHRRNTTIAPYPRENEHVPMPSPPSHVARPLSPPVRNSTVPTRDGEYTYVRRTMRPPDRTLDDLNKAGYDTYYEGERLHTRKASPKRAQQDLAGTTEERRRRPSDASSRVRFSKKVEVSPTPPGSDASSAQFRDFGRRAGHSTDLPLRGGDLTAEYERRGRTLSRAPDRADGYGHERVPDHLRNLDVYKSTVELDLDQRGFQHPASRTGYQGYPSGSVHSESPAEKKLLESMRRQRSEAFGPYAMEEKRSVSVHVEDGSTMDSGSSSNEDDRRRSGKAGRRGSRR